jgi:hypothetical protein
MQQNLAGRVQQQQIAVFAMSDGHSTSFVSFDFSFTLLSNQMLCVLIQQFITLK